MPWFPWNLQAFCQSTSPIYNVWSINVCPLLIEKEVGVAPPYKERGGVTKNIMSISELTLDYVMVKLNKYRKLCHGNL